MTNPGPSLNGWLVHESCWLVEGQDLDLFGRIDIVNARVGLRR